MRQYLLLFYDFNTSFYRLVPCHGKTQLNDSILSMHRFSILVDVFVFDNSDDMEFFRSCLDLTKLPKYTRS